MSDPGWREEFAEFIVDEKKIESELCEVERGIVQRYDLGEPTRDELIALMRSGAVEEDELVIRWHSLYSQLISMKEG